MNCKHCGKYFEASHFNQRYCSVNCRTSFNHAKPPTGEATCLFCGKTFLVKNYRVGVAHYCSNKCKGFANLSKYKVTKTGICLTCGNQFSSSVNENTVIKYCSQGCRKAASRRRYVPAPQKCLFCGKDYEVFQCHKAKTKFCSIACRRAYQKMYAPPTLKRGVNRSMRRAGLIKQCADCDYSDIPDILVIHHLNGGNNHSPDNLIVLCPNCHAIRHLKK